MVQLELCNGQKWSIRPGLKRNLDIGLNDIKNNEMDLVIVIDGPEGAGKSFMARGLALYCATYLNSSFGVEDIYFELEDYINKSLEAGSPENNGNRHKINVLDEGRNVMNRRRSTSYENVRFTNYLSECRAMGQVHIILSPAFHDLDRYIILWRMSMLIHCQKNYVKDPKNEEVGVKLLRGEYRLFVNTAGGKKMLKFCYDNGNYTYPHVYEERNLWSCREVFTPEQIKEYNEKKYKATIEKYYKEQEELDIEKQEREEIKRLKEEYAKPASLYCRQANLNYVTLINYLNAGKIKGVKIKGRWYIHNSEFEALP